MYIPPKHFWKRYEQITMRTRLFEFDKNQTTQGLVFFQTLKNQIKQIGKYFEYAKLAKIKTFEKKFSRTASTFQFINIRLEIISYDPSNKINGIV